MEYCQIFGEDDNFIELTIFEQPVGLGLIGILTSKLFGNTIGLLQDEEDTSGKNYHFACFVSADETHGFVRMDKSLIDALKQGDMLAEMILLHEVGHYVHGDFPKGRGLVDDVDAERGALTGQGKVRQRELKADEFAAKYLGKESVVSALDKLKEFIKKKYGNHEDWDVDSVNLSVREIELRMEHLWKMETIF